MAGSLTEKRRRRFHLDPEAGQANSRPVHVDIDVAVLAPGPDLNINGIVRHVHVHATMSAGGLGCRPAAGTANEDGCQRRNQEKPNHRTSLHTDPRRAGHPCYSSAAGQATDQRDPRRQGFKNAAWRHLTAPQPSVIVSIAEAGQHGPKYRVEVIVPARQGIRLRRHNPGFRSADLLVRPASAFLCANSQEPTGRGPPRNGTARGQATTGKVRPRRAGLCP